jgi:hypothetical protein
VGGDAGRPKASARTTLTPARKNARTLHAAEQPPGADREVRLEAGERAAGEASTFDRSLRGAGCGERSGRVVDAMLERLRDLDPGRDRIRPTAVREVAPRLERLIVATQAAQEAGPIGDDSLAIDAHR